MSAHNFVNYLRLIPNEPTFITDEFQQETLKYLASLNYTEVPEQKELQVYEILKLMGLIDFNVVVQTPETQAISINLTEYGKQVTQQVS